MNHSSIHSAKLTWKTKTLNILAWRRNEFISHITNFRAWSFDNLWARELVLLEGMNPYRLPMLHEWPHTQKYVKSTSWIWVIIFKTRIKIWRGRRIGVGRGGVIGRTQCKYDQNTRCEMFEKIIKIVTLIKIKMNKTWNVLYGCFSNYGFLHCHCYTLSVFDWSCDFSHSCIIDCPLCLCTLFSKT